MKKGTKKLLTGLLATTMLIAGCSKVGKKPENAIAKVGDVYISAEEVQEYFTYYKEQMEMFGQGGNFDETTEEGKKQALGIRSEILQSLVMQEQTVEVSKKEGIKVSEEEVNASIDNLVEQAGGEDALKEFLKENNLTEEEFRKEQYDSFEMQNYITKLDDKLKEELAPSDDEVEKRIKEDKDSLLPVYNANHILFTTMDEMGQPITDEAKIEEIRKEAQAKLDEIKTDKEKFEKAFEEYKPGENKTSQDTPIKAEELGNFNGKDMVPEFTEAVESMNPGEISQELVKTQFGFHIIQEISKAEEFDQLDEKYYNDQLMSNYKDMIVEEEITKYKEEEIKKIDVEFYDKDGNVVEDAQKAIESFDFSKIKGPNDDKKESSDKDESKEKETENTDTTQETK
ncbi:MAG: SurA N-terminal domain-containing protein [Lagierella massiliensis]|nr:SurA N-terminal domain-containing protein [Lagierella massiliensis]